MYGYESWTIKKAECWIDAFELWCGGVAEEMMLLNCGIGEDSWVPWTARRSNQSILKEISPQYSLEGLMLKVKLQVWPPDAKNWLIWKDPDAEKDWGQEEKGTAEDEMVGWPHQLDGHEFDQALGVGDGQESLACCSPWGQSWTQLSHWTELNWPCICEFISGLSIVFHWSVFILIPCWLPQLCNMVWNKAWRPYCSYCIFHTPWASQVVLVVKNLPANEGDVRETSSIPGLGRSPGGQGGNSLQYSCLENPRDKGVWRATVHGVAQCQTWLKWLSMHAHAL